MTRRHLLLATTGLLFGACGTNPPPTATPTPDTVDATTDTTQQADTGADTAPAVGPDTGADVGNKWAQADGCQHPAVMFDEGPPAQVICPGGPGTCGQPVPTHPFGKPCILDTCWDPPLHVCSAKPDNAAHLFCKPDGTLCCVFGMECTPCGWVLCNSAVDPRCPPNGDPYPPGPAPSVPGGEKQNPPECQQYQPVTPEHQNLQFCEDDYDTNPLWCSHARHDDDTVDKFPAGVVPLWMPKK